MTTRRLRRTAIAVLTALGLGASAACGAGGSGGSAGEAAGGPVELTFVAYSVGTPDIGGQAMAKLIDRFEATHPGITVRPEPVAVADVLTRLKADTAAGAAPDVAQIGWSKMVEATATLPVVPVQRIPTPQEWAAHTAGMTPALLAAVAQDGVVPALPFTVSVPTLFYNADLFRAAGLDPARPPRTIEEIRAAGLALAARGSAGAYLALADSGKSDYLTQSVVNSAGGSVVGPDGAVTLDQPAAVAALGAVGDLTRSGAQPNISTTDALAQFGAGRLGMLLSSTAALASLERSAAGRFDLRTAAFPRFGPGPARPTYSGAGLAVLARDPARQRAAWEFARFMTSPEAFTTMTAEIGYLPLRPALADDPAGLRDYFNRNPRLRPALDELAAVAPYQSFPGRAANRAVVVLQDEAVEPIVLRGADPGPTLAAAAEKIRGLTAR